MWRLILSATFGVLIVAGCNGDGKNSGGSGFIEADEVLVSAETAGRILMRDFDEGSIIKNGDTLAVIDPSRLQLQIAAAVALRHSAVASLVSGRIAVTKSKETEKYALSERDRIARLLKTGSATQKQMDQLEYEASQATVGRQAAEANVAVLQTQIDKIDADLGQLNRQIKDCYPLSPVSGVVTEKYVEVGEVVAPGKGIAKIANLDTVWVKVYLPVGEYSAVKVGAFAKISTESGSSSYTGSIIWTSQEAEFTPKNVQTEKSRANLVYAVKVRIPNTDGLLKVGMPVFVTLEK